MMNIYFENQTQKPNLLTMNIEQNNNYDSKVFFFFYY